MKQVVDVNKAIQSCHLILSSLEGCDFHKLFKILYFAEQQHLTDYGRTITGDTYIAMNNGPVPSFIYDMLKHIRGDNPYFNAGLDINKEFEVVNKYYANSIGKLDTDYLSASDIEYIEKSIAEYSNKTFGDLTTLSHGSAWQKASRDNEMSILDIAEEGGANVEMLKYISQKNSNQIL